MPYLIEDNILDDLCRFIALNESTFPTGCSILWQVQYSTGCRASESCNLSLWNVINELTVCLSPLKYSDKRFFNIDELHPYFIDALIMGESNYQNILYRQLQYNIDKLIRCYGISSGSKSCSNHLFRHNYARKLKNRGLTDSQVKEKMGERNQSSADQYIYGKLYSTYPITL
jgi:site-specific recombinase XerD